MEFTIAEYKALVKALKEAEYEFAGYVDWQNYKKPVCRS